MTRGLALLPDGSVSLTGELYGKLSLDEADTALGVVDFGLGLTATTGYDETFVVALVP